MAKKRVGVLFGGRSGEHEVSLNSARNVMDALQQAGHQVVPIGISQEGHWLTSGDPMKMLTDQSGPVSVKHHTDAGETPVQNTHDWTLLPATIGDESMPAIDVIFPVLHGPYGEDGTVQGMLDLANIPYVGCGVLGSAVGMDKAIAKKVFTQEGLRQANYRVVMRTLYEGKRDAVVDELMTTLAAPYFVKPANMGSSVGVSKADNRDELVQALETAALYDRKLIVEEAVPNAREIEVSVLGNDEPRASSPGEIIPGSAFYDYDDKYINDASELLIPAPLTKEQTLDVQSMALRAFQAIDGSGLARVDFLMDDATGIFYLNELNTMPGFTRISMYPKLWEESGLSYPQLVDELLNLALERFAERQRNSTVRLV
ncbi:MAG: D-alanine--D-alanine ligase family protein [Chloroflexota bacterium]